jgi:hypothetical protein
MGPPNEGALRRWRKDCFAVATSAVPGTAERRGDALRWSRGTLCKADTGLQLDIHFGPRSLWQVGLARC